MSKTFLTAEWRKLAMANYAIDPKQLQSYIPYKTELDLWNNTCYVSLVGFMFVNTKIKGFKIPFHVNFEEVNLRFYVRFKEDNEWKRGVVFIKEIVPKPALTLVANTVYRENYETMPMNHSWEIRNETLRVEYKWKKNRWNSFRIDTEQTCNKIESGSKEEFITEHYWGYTKIHNTHAAEYGVEHPRWDVYKTKEYSIDVDFKDVYGQDFAFLQSLNPESIFLAEGSEIKVLKGKAIR